MLCELYLGILVIPGGWSGYQLSSYVTRTKPGSRVKAEEATNKDIRLRLDVIYDVINNTLCSLMVLRREIMGALHRRGRQSRRRMPPTAVIG